MRTSTLGREIVEAFEGCMAAVPGRGGFYTTYRDEAGVTTIGYGHTNLGNVPPLVKPGVVWTKEMCDDALSADLVDSELAVIRALDGTKFTPNQNEFDALVSFEFNTGHLARSSIPSHLAKGDLEGAMAVLMLYNHAGGRTLAGLTRRRMCERALFLGHVQEAANLADAHLQADPVVQIQTSMSVPTAVEPQAALPPSVPPGILPTTVRPPQPVESVPTEPTEPLVPPPGQLPS